MANVFAITSVADKLKAENGSATTVFTVTNTTSRPLRGVAKVKPIGNTEASWVKIDGETERDFPAGGTHQFTVSFNKPKPPNPPTASQPAESFPFRFDEISAANPDEDFTEGPIVTVEIPEQTIKEKKPFPWLIVGAVAALLLVVVGVVLFLVLRNGDVEIPNVTTKTYAEAEAELKTKGFTAEKVEEIAPDKVLDTVFKQDPAGGEKVAADKKKIKLSVPAKTTVPQLAGNCLVQAIDELTKRQLLPGTISGDRNEIATCARKVGSTEPLPNQPIAKGASVNLSFPCVPLSGKVCFNFPLKDIISDQRLQLSPMVIEKLKVAPTP